jgi:hypothetical protein
LIKIILMKKFLSIITFIGLGASAMAQTIKVGPEVGATYVTMSQKLNGASRETNYQLGFKVGGIVDIQLNDYFSLQPGLFISANNGTESKYERFYKSGAGLPTSDYDRRNYQTTYIQIPVYALYKTGKEFDDPHFFFGIGPYFAYGIGGRFKQDYTNTLNGVDITKRYDYTMPFGNDRTKDKLRPFDLGANVTIGYESPMGLLFRAYYGIGFLNIAPSGNSDNCFRNQGGGLSIGFLFKTSNRPHWQ